MRLIDADAKITVVLYNEECEETEYLEMTVADYLDSGTEEGCPQIVSGWVSVKDRLPEENGEYLISTTDGVTSACYERGRHVGDRHLSEWTDYYEGCINFEPTHWMPLPKPPKEADNETKK